MVVDYLNDALGYISERIKASPFDGLEDPSAKLLAMVEKSIHGSFMDDEHLRYKQLRLICEGVKRQFVFDECLLLHERMRFLLECQKNSQSLLWKPLSDPQCIFASSGWIKVCGQIKALIELKPISSGWNLNECEEYAYLAYEIISPVVPYLVRIMDEHEDFKSRKWQRHWGWIAAIGFVGSVASAVFAQFIIHYLHLSP